MQTNYRATKQMAVITRRALALRETMPRGNRAGTLIGLARANQIANRSPMSITTIKRMYHFFLRNQRFKNLPELSKGRQAWLLWGGMPGFIWSRNILRKEGIINK